MRKLLATQNLKRQKKLVAARIAAPHDTEQAQNDYEQALSELARARLSELHITNPAKMAADTLTYIGIGQRFVFKPKKEKYFHIRIMSL